ncbi:XRE family transcriptional regulator [Lachnospiraceae bacterium]|jgi:DNA-binding Xre family transcriptional regulator|nr:XRE family transcriptional regulator [Lachnospiraceae bacterium]
MAVNYKKLFHLMIEKNLSNSDLQRKAGFSGNILTRLKRNRYVSLESIESICHVLECGVDDILEFIPEEETDNG